MQPLIRPLQPEDETNWRRLWTGYLQFYQTSVPDTVYLSTFARLLGEDPRDFSALVAEVDGQLLGLTHYLFHRHAWKIEEVCYLQDLYVAPRSPRHRPWPQVDRGRLRPRRRRRGTSRLLADAGLQPRGPPALRPHCEGHSVHPLQPPVMTITIAPYDPAWPRTYATEATQLRQLLPLLRDLEHIGSTSVPGLAAKPVIDIMAAVDSLDEVTPHLPALAPHGYAVVDAGMHDRLFLQRAGFNLHIVTLASWPRRKERLMRDALIADPSAATEYAALKRQLALVHGDDLPAYTRAKTAFVQGIMDQIHDRLGWPREDVWDD